MINKRVKKITIYSLVFIALVGAVHALVVMNAERIISDEVHRQTNGRFKLDIGNIKINYRKLSIEIRDSKIEVMDSAITSQLVMIEAPYLGIHLSSFTGMVFRSDLSIDSLICDMPHITISARKKSIKNTSLSYELGQILLSIRKTLDALEVEKLRINGGMVTINPDNAELRPIVMKDLNLGIDHFKSKNKNTQEKEAFLTNNDVNFHAGKQVLTTQDNVRSFCFRSIDISTKNKWVILDSCTFRGNKVGLSYAMFFQELRLVNLDFNRLYEANTLHTDSALCKGVKLSVQLNRNLARKSRKTTEQLTEETMKTLTQNLELKYVSLSGSEIVLINKIGEKIETYSSREHSFELIDVGMNSGLSSPIQIGEIRFHLFNYKGYSDDSLFAVTFESMSLVNRDLLLNNFEIAPTDKYTGYLRNRASIAQLTLKNISFAAALFERRMVTDEIIVDKPFIHVITDERSSGEHKPILEVLNSLDHSFGIKKTTFVNGTIVSEHIREHRSLRIEGLNTVIRPTEILSASGVKDVLNAVDYAVASKVELRHRDKLIRFSKVSLDNKQNLTIARVELNNGENKVNASGVRVIGIKVERDNSIMLDELSWDGAEVNYSSDTSAYKNNNATNSFPFISVNTVLLKNTSIRSVYSMGVRMTGEVEYLSVKNFSFNSLSTIRFEDFETSGREIFLQKDISSLRLQKFNIHHNKNSFFKGLSYSHRTILDTIQAEVPLVNFVPDIMASLEQKAIVMKRLDVFHPTVLLRVSESTHTSTMSTAPPETRIDKFSMKELSLDAIVHNSKGDIVLVSDKGTVAVDNARIGAKGIKTDKFSVQLNKLKFNYRDSVMISSEKEGLYLELDHFNKEGSEMLAVTLNRAVFNADYLTVINKEGDEPFKLYKATAEVENILVTYPIVGDGIKKMFSHPQFSVQNTSGEIITQTHIVKIKQFSYFNSTATVGFKSFDYVPIMDRQAYTQIYRTQSDYMKVHIGECTLNKFNLADNIFSKKIIGGDLIINNLDLQTYKDRRLPAGPERNKKLPTVLLKSIPFPFELRSANILNSKVEYVEVSAKNGKEGIVKLNRINLKVEGIKNHHLTYKDSLSLTAEVWLMDSARLNVNFKESYLDSLNGFVLKVQSTAFDLRILNSFTEALASIYIKSGYLNSLSMVAVGREFIALGEMKFYYDNLDIDLIGNKEETQRNIINSFTSMVANDIIIKKENHNRTSLVYFERLRNKSVFNYWIKITLSGIMTTVGVRQTMIYKRRYRNYVRKNKLPAVL